MNVVARIGREMALGRTRATFIGDCVKFARERVLCTFVHVCDEVQLQYRCVFFKIKHVGRVQNILSSSSSVYSNYHLPVFLLFVIIFFLAVHSFQRSFHSFIIFSWWLLQWAPAVLVLADAAGAAFSALAQVCSQSITFSCGQSIQWLLYNF